MQSTYPQYYPQHSEGDMPPCPEGSKDKLSAVTVRAAAYRDRPFKLFDGGGLFLHLQRAGKYWRLKYRFGGREKLLALGVDPAPQLTHDLLCPFILTNLAQSNRVLAPRTSADSESCPAHIYASSNGPPASYPS